MNRADIPKVGPTGSPVTTAKIHDRSGCQLVHWGPPRAPDRYVYETDDDGFTDVRRMTDEEYSAAMDRYRNSFAEWERTGGMAMVQMAPDEWTVRVTCEDGSTGEGIWSGEAWVWVGWTEVTKARMG